MPAANATPTLLVAIRGLSPPLDGRAMLRTSAPFRTSRMIRILYALALVLAVMACRPGPPEAEIASPIRDQKRCTLQGNRASAIYCATTYTQLLADPDDYAGRRVRIVGWGVTDGDTTLLFPSEDSLLSAETHASLLIKDSEGARKLVSYLERHEYASARVAVGGVLRFDNEQSGTPSRFGVLEEVEFFH